MSENKKFQNAVNETTEDPQAIQRKNGIKFILIVFVIPLLALSFALATR